MVVDRLLAEAIAREEQPLAPRVPDGEREHPVDALRKRFAPLLVPVDEHLGVAVAAEHVSVRNQLGAQMQVVVDLAVEGDPDGPVLVRHRLGAGRGEIDDRQAPVAERDGPVHVQAAPVGAAMRDDLRHASDELAVGRLSGIAVQEAADAAHAGSSVVARGEMFCRTGAGSGWAAKPYSSSSRRTQSSLSSTSVPRATRRAGRASAA